MGIVGFDRRGDISPARVAVYRVTGAGATRAVPYAEFEGASLDRFVSVPARLRG